MTTNEETHEESGHGEIPEAEPMKPRQVAGEINRAREVFVYVCWGVGADGEDYYPISKQAAKEIVAHAQESDLDIYVAKNGRKLYIGPCDEEEEGEGEGEDPEPEPGDEPEPGEEGEEGGE